LAILPMIEGFSKTISSMSFPVFIISTLCKESGANSDACASFLDGNIKI
jgi:hypothetical protein